MWQPRASAETLRTRSQIKRRIQDFFNQRNMLEIDAPLLQSGANLDPGINPLYCEQGYFITSPEHSLKRCLAAGYGDCWALTPVFRLEENGQRHNTEFHMLEWYRCGMSFAAFADEVIQLLNAACQWNLPVEKHSYRKLFRMLKQVDPITSNVKELQKAAGPDMPANGERAELCDYIMATHIEPRLRGDMWHIVEDFPAWSAAQAQIQEDNDGEKIADRFEIFYNGLELANAYHECTDAKEMTRRFAEELRERNHNEYQVDQHYLDALQAGLPESCGIAVGFDRLIMCATKNEDIRDVLVFDFERR